MVIVFSWRKYVEIDTDDNFASSGASMTLVLRRS